MHMFISVLDRLGFGATEPCHRIFGNEIFFLNFFIRDRYVLWMWAVCVSYDCAAEAHSHNDLF